MHYITFDNVTTTIYNINDIYKIENPHNVKKLYLSYNKLTSLPDNIFNSLTQLQLLTLSYNKLTSLPISIRKCKLLYYYKKKHDIPDLKYILELPDLINREIKKYYYKPVLDYYNSKYF
jgi:Leucine-rich repeat (LRR) protein